MKKLVVIVLLGFIAILSSCKVSPHTIKKMREKYMDDQNYVALSGEIIEIEEKIEIDVYEIDIKCEEIGNYISYQSSICSYHIFSKEILDLNIGDTIDFVTVPYHFFNGHNLPIVEVKMNGNTLLNIYDGKTNLMEWVNSLK
ncbi:hypothetical protein [Thomasclavelia cocleata]|uniref:hypothetical protein n=1 Tax=Thomasclavelia cocleata TaxID=69824 RepID=UPI002573E182|nr:hypothetical protein [Thomasclavelia cocleata]